MFKSIVERPVPKVCDMQCMHDSVVMNIHVHVREMKKEGRKKQATQSHFSKEK